LIRCRKALLRISQTLEIGLIVCESVKKDGSKGSKCDRCRHPLQEPLDDAVKKISSELQLWLGQSSSIGQYEEFVDKTLSCLKTVCANTLETKAELVDTRIA
jgi:chemotaxis regulatin CheY-phosphate phosphatase CheZ